MLSPEELNFFVSKYGAGWCHCMVTQISELTPDKLAAYCVEQEFRAYPEPIYEDTDKSTRYQYLVKETRRLVKGKEVVDIVVAGFGKFPYHPFQTLDTVLGAIRKIASATGQNAHEIAEEILKTKELERVNPSNNVARLEHLNEAYRSASGGAAVVHRASVDSGGSEGDRDTDDSGDDDE